MTEAEWLECTEPAPMLEFVLDRASERKLRLFAAACCRRAWHLMTDPRHRRAVKAAERLADGRIGEAEFEEALQPIVALCAELPDAREGKWEPLHYMAAAARHLGGGSASYYLADFAARGLACRAGAKDSPSWLAARRAEETAQCELLRDLFGDPSRPFQFAPAWLSGPGARAVELARTIYEEGRFADVPLLADVLEGAGCHDRAAIDHCRARGEHVRGCWVADALLGKESAVRAGLTTAVAWRECQNPEPLLHFLNDRGSNRKWRLYAVACCRRIGHLIRDERVRRALEVAARLADGAVSAEEVEAAHAAAKEAAEEARDAEYRAEAEANFCLTPAYAAASCRLAVALAALGALSRDVRRADAEADSREADYWGRTDRCAAEAAADEACARFGSSQNDSRWEESGAVTEAARSRELRAHCALLRDIFGDHFGPPGGEGRWLPVGPEEGLPRRPTEQWCLLPTPLACDFRGVWLTWNNGIVHRLAAAIYRDGAFERLPILADALEDAGCDDLHILSHLRGSGPHVRGCWVVDLILGKE